MTSIRIDFRGRVAKWYRVWLRIRRLQVRGLSRSSFLITHLRSLPLLLVSHQINMCWTRHPQVRGSHFFIVIFLIISHLIVPIILIPLVIEVPFSLSAIKYIYSFDIPDFTSDVRTRSAVLRYVCVLTILIITVDLLLSIDISALSPTICYGPSTPHGHHHYHHLTRRCPPFFFRTLIRSIVPCSHLSIQEPQRTRPGTSHYSYEEWNSRFYRSHIPWRAGSIQAIAARCCRNCWVGYWAEGSSLLSVFSNRRSCTKGGGFLSRFSLPSKNLREQERLLYTAWLELAEPQSHYRIMVCA